ncbi:PiggyBac transposable element-derived protein 4-like [Elysia marginata]|uniref:PiggyBac transposable element-derived protein 4-like n=1 Tax=Elysia marginata TaxID=1093978 RepID=A0AAV4JV65_9GAST|nr:PiggyBac transposable element-derived protein 4-like [Elysia marginata]
MGLVYKPNIKWNWSTNPIIETPIFQKVMPQNRFLALLSFFHLADNAHQPERHSANYDKLYKIRPFFDHLNARFPAIYYPQQQLAFDESMMPFRGRIEFHQYLPSKPIKYGMKLYMCCESTSGYVLSMKFYTGANTTGPERGHGEQVVRELTQTYLDLDSDKDTTGHGFTTNWTAVYASLQAGFGDMRHNLWCENMGIPSLHHKTFQKHASNIYKQTLFLRRKIFLRAAKIVMQQMSILHAVDYSKDDIIDIAVSYDTSWLTRGHTSHKALQNLRPYDDDVEIEKEECVNNVGKRLGSALRNLESDSSKRRITLGGRDKGRLTANAIRKLQIYYSHSILNNSSAADMQQAIMASLYNCLSMDSDPSHHLCPPADINLLKRCERKATQNANESLHSAIWACCPKDRFSSKPKVEHAVITAICNFNFGPTEQHAVTSISGVILQASSVALSEKRLARRIRNNQRKMNAANQHRRKKS